MKNGLCSNNQKVDNIINELIDEKINISQIPEEYENDLYLVKKLRELEFVKVFERGYDILSNTFFVVEYKVGFRNKKKRFDDFKSYYEYLDGDIYNNSCYSFYDFNNDIDFIKEKNIDISKLEYNVSFCDKTIDDLSIDVLIENEREERQIANDNKNILKHWCKKVNECVSSDELAKVLLEFENAAPNLIDYEMLLFFNYAYYDVSDNNRLSVLVDFLVNAKYEELLCKKYGSNNTIRLLIYIFNSDYPIVNYKPIGLAQSTTKNHIRNYKLFYEDLNKGVYDIKKNIYFSKELSVYVEETVILSGISERSSPKSIRMFFDIDELAEHCNNYFTNCDFSNSNDDFSNSKFIIDKSTILPFDYKNIKLVEVKKEYTRKHPIFLEYIFRVTKVFVDKNGTKKNLIYETDYFSDFVFFLKNDLSDADLFECNGLENVVDKGIILDGAVLQSHIYDVLDLNVKSFEYNKELLNPISFSLDNENIAVAERQNVELERKEILYDYNAECDYNDGKICYVSDLHLMHKINQKNCKSDKDVELLISDYATQIINEMSNVLLIAGDISYDFNVFKLFIEKLKEGLSRKDILSDRCEIVFVLGNHDLWSFKDKSFDEIIKEYRDLIESNGMYLLQNDLAYINEYYQLRKMSYNKLKNSSDDDILQELKTARRIIFGSLGFAGCNDDYNANIGLYRGVITREQEIDESKKCEQLYSRLVPLIKDKNVVILTHNQISDWSNNSMYQHGFVYVAGHNHYNEYFDDGSTRFYYDNQVGYKNNSIHLKSFDVDYKYFLFNDYNDGIYDISLDEYKSFCRGINNPITLRTSNHIFMLKKQGYYCFIEKNKQNKLMILNGGHKKTLPSNDIDYYFEHMYEVILKVNEPFIKYTSIQNNIADIVKRIGGEGYIHGCIIDIDYYNHIYLNPIDLTVTGYYATDTVNKYVYNSVELLLESKCPLLYANYKKYLETNQSNKLQIFIPKDDEHTEPQLYTDTDIYTASYKVKKMQKLENNVLSFWYDDIDLDITYLDE